MWPNCHSHFRTTGRIDLFFFTSRSTVVILLTDWVDTPQSSKSRGSGCVAT